MRSHELMTKAELAAYAGRSRSTIHRWEKRGILPPTVDLGGREYFRRSTVRAWLSELEGRNERPDLPSREAIEATAARLEAAGDVEGLRALIEKLRSRAQRLSGPDPR